MRRRTLLHSVLGVAAVSATAGCSSEQGEDAPSVTPVAVSPQPVALSANGLPGPIKIGIMVSLSSLPGEGTDWALAAEGARVAAHRFGLAGHRVELVPVDDQGSTAHAVEAIAGLAEQGVAGVVLATSGTHVQQAIVEATSRKLPVVWPYGVADDYLLPGAWATGPLRSQHDAAIVAALDRLGVSQPILITGMGATTPADLEPVAELQFNLASQNEATFIESLSALALETGDSVVIIGDADSSAQAAIAVRRAGVSLPILLTDAARSPVFSQRMMGDTGSLNGTYWCVGVDNDDPASVRRDATGQAVAAFVEAVSATASTEATRFFEETPFSEVAYAADTASHDAVVALVKAAAQAKRTDAAGVLAALPRLIVDHEDGLAGPTLNCETLAALPAESVVPLVATATYAASRPGNHAMLRWFAAAEGV